jgi:glycosyltransferase involved in cell wall biosynthesis
VIPPNTPIGRPLRVMHVASQLDVGGLEKLLVEFARHADRSAVALEFVSLSTAGKIAGEITALGWPVTALQSPDGFRLGTIWKLARLFRRRRVDVVHAHNTKAVIYCGLARRLARVGRLLYTRHGQRYGAKSRSNRLFRLAVRSVDDIVCVSEDAAKLSAAEGLPAVKISAIRNGIDTARFAYTGPADGGPAVMVGRLSPEKDVQTLLDAVVIVARDEPAFRLEIAGSGSMLEPMKQRAAASGLAGTVTFLGNVNDIPALLGRASMTVLSSFTEGISLTLLEAMSRGLPVVATRVGGNPEVVVDGLTGRLVPARNAATLAAAILDLWRNPSASKSMGLAGNDRVKNHFDVRVMVRAYESLYRKVQGQGPRVAASENWPPG